jgi:fatty acid desaturase
MFVVPELSPPEKLDRDVVARLAVMQPYRFVLALLFDVTVIAVAIAVSEHFYFNAIAYVGAVVVIGARLHALGVLFHDVAHHRAFKSRVFNTVIGELLGWSIMTTLEGYRNNHLTHHRNLNTLEDPDWTRKLPANNFDFPKAPRYLMYELLRQISGIGFLELFLALRNTKEMSQISRRSRIMRGVFYAAILSISLYFGVLDKLLLYWVIPMMTVFTCIFYIRSVAEHHGNMEYDHTYTNSRSIMASGWEKFFFMPHGVGYHLDHHLYPHIPFYNLPELHEELMRCPIFRSRAHITNGVLGLLREYTDNSKGPSMDVIRKHYNLGQAA